MRSRPVARVQLATVSQRRFCRDLRAALTLRCTELLNCYDSLGCRGCGTFPMEANCIQGDTKWCECCALRAPSCWKCYRPRHVQSSAIAVSLCLVTAGLLVMEVMEALGQMMLKTYMHPQIREPVSLPGSDRHRVSPFSTVGGGSTKVPAMPSAHHHCDLPPFPKPYPYAASLCSANRLSQGVFRRLHGR